MSSLLHQSARDYCALVDRLNRASPGYHGLHEFVNIQPDNVQTPAKFTLLTLSPQSLEKEPDSILSTEDFNGTTILAEKLTTSISKPGTCNIFFVENLCPQTVALLGGAFDINPQFFADHVQNGDWFKDHDLMDQIPALPSSQKWHDFLQVRFIQTLSVGRYPSSDSSSSNSILKAAEPDSRYDYMLPDETITRLPRKAGKLVPRARDDQDLELLLCTKQSITVWFGERKRDNGGWNCVILLDSPFQLPPGSSSFCHPPLYRSFMRRPTLADPSISDIGPHSTNRAALIRHLKERISDPALRHLARYDCFFALGDLYQLTASNWMVINEYINREITTIEYKLEREELNFRDLEVYLKDLYLHRRRITRYHELISETKSQFNKRGPRAWPRDDSSELAMEQARDWEDDFTNLQLWFKATSARMEKNIRLLTALVAISEGKQGLAENHGIARLSLLAMVFLPFSSVATILGMQGNFAPGDRQFWLFWVVGITLTTLVVGLFLLYDKLIAQAKGYRLRLERRRAQRKRKLIVEEEEKLTTSLQ